MPADGRRLAAIMFTDVVGFTALAQEDEVLALRLLREQAELVHATIGPHRGREVKSIGDGLLLEFPSALDAVRCAVELQQRLHERAGRPGTHPLRVRIGLHVGDVEGEGSDILGDAVNIASRVESLAEPGSVYLSEQVFDQVRSKVPYRLEPLGPKSLKGVQAPMRVFRVALPWNETGAAPSASSTPRIAVLPLANISPDPRDEYFADGLTEELIAGLSRLRGLRVIARTSVSQYKSAPKPVRQIGEELGVGAVLEGSVRKAGDRLRITLQLIDPLTEEQRWAETYDRELDDVFAIQTEVAEKTATALRTELLGPDGGPLRPGPTTSLDAYELYLRGMTAFQHAADEGWTRPRTEASVRYLEAAIAKDPGYPPSYALLANVLIAAMGEALPHREVPAARVRELVDRALTLNPASSAAHTARGNYALQFEQDWDRAEAEFRRAIALNPSEMAAHAWYGILLHSLGRSDESLRELAAASQLDPLFLNLVIWQVRVLRESGDPEGALALGTDALSREPGARRLHVQQGFTYLALGRPDDARREVALASGQSLDAAGQAHRAVLLAQLGEPEEARGLIAAWRRDPNTAYLRGGYVAEVLVALGEPDAALDLLEREYAQGESSLWIDYRRTAFDAVRADPRFVALLEKTRLPTARPRAKARGG